MKHAHTDNTLNTYNLARYTYSWHPFPISSGFRELTHSSIVGISLIDGQIVLCVARGADHTCPLADSTQPPSPSVPYLALRHIQASFEMVKHPEPDSPWCEHQINHANFVPHEVWANWGHSLCELFDFVEEVITDGIYRDV